ETSFLVVIAVERKRAGLEARPSYISRGSDGLGRRRRRCRGRRCRAATGSGVAGRGGAGNRRVVGRRIARPSAEPVPLREAEEQENQHQKGEDRGRDAGACTSSRLT